jgi:hypothetical protein
MSGTRSGLRRETEHIQNVIRPVLSLYGALSAMTQHGRNR